MRPSIPGSVVVRHNNLASPPCGGIKLLFCHSVFGASAGLPADAFDLVALWDVVEHVPDPKALLREAVGYLVPGGHLILETQNVESVFARLLGARWHQYKHLEHLYHFSSTTLRRLLEEAGLEVVHETARFGGKHVSLAFIRERATRIHPILGR